MSCEKSFVVLGGPVEILISSARTGGAFTVLTQGFEPGGGPPPHHHLHEDEFFLPSDGDFEIYDGHSWTKLTADGIFAPRGGVHTFRNCGTAYGKLMVVVSPGGMDVFLERISVVQMPQDLQKLIDISAEFGLTYPEMAEAH